MTKRELLFQIRQAYIGHIKWRSAAQATHLGLSHYAIEIEIDPKKTEFGKWYYGIGQMFSDVEIIKKMEIYNNRIHYIYNNICKLENAKNDSNFFSNLFNESLSTPEELKLAYFRDLLKQSKELLLLLKEFESAISNS